MTSELFGYELWYVFMCTCSWLVYETGSVFLRLIISDNKCKQSDACDHYIINKNEKTIVKRKYQAVNRCQLQI